MKVPVVVVTSLLGLIAAGIVFQLTLLRELDQRLTRVETKLDYVSHKP